MFGKLTKGLFKLKTSFSGKLRQLLGKPMDEEMLEMVESLLYTADLGSDVVEEMIANLKTSYYQYPKAGYETHLRALKQAAREMLEGSEGALPLPKESPEVHLVVGVNGSGKTTTCAKLAKYYQTSGIDFLCVAGDTFRQAAVEQLTLWSEQLKFDLVKSQTGGDPSACIYDGIEKAIHKNKQLVLVDTAGRLESKTDLMNELGKITRVIQKKCPNGPHQTYFVLDATIGQTAISQLKAFHEVSPISQIILTKLDGSAKAGAVIPIFKELKIPIAAVGDGEGASDLKPFLLDEYLDALFADQKS